MEPEVRAAIQSQFLAAIDMLRETVERCPDDLWTAPARCGAFWQVAYHTLFFVHLYSQPTEGAFTPWAKHRTGADDFGPEPADTASGAYRRDEILEYLRWCRQEVARRLGEVDPAAPSGFHWLPFRKLELQLYSLRHVQQHAGELSARLMAHGGIKSPWVGRGTADA